MNPSLIERPVVVVAGAPAAGKTTFTREKLMRDGADIANLLREVLKDDATWRRARAVVQAIAGGDASAYWPAPGFDTLCLTASATRAAVVELHLARFALDHLRAAASEWTTLILEATPAAAVSILRWWMPGELVLVEVDEAIREHRIAERLGPDRRSEGPSVARFQRVAHRAAWEQLRASASYGWRVSENKGK